MKRELLMRFLVTVFGVLAVSSAAHSADLRDRSGGAPPPPPLSAPVFNWSGFHIGANAGYAFGDRRSTTIGTPAFQTLIAPGFVPAVLSSGAEGFIGGGQIGASAQLGSIVVGVEADIQGGQSTQSASFTGLAVLGTRLRTGTESKLDYLGTVRGRLGVAFDRFHVYGTAGLAYGKSTVSASVDGVDAPALVWQGTTSSLRTGYVLGAGAEYAFTSNLVGRFEYLFFDLGKQGASAGGNAAVRAVGALNGIDYASSTGIRGSVIRGAVSYKF
jgi:outer membrane immunogenic protein